MGRNRIYSGDDGLDRGKTLNNAIVMDSSFGFGGVPEKKATMQHENRFSSFGLTPSKTSSEKERLDRMLYFKQQERIFQKKIDVLKRQLKHERHPMRILRKLFSKQLKIYY